MKRLIPNFYGGVLPEWDTTEYDVDSKELKKCVEMSIDEYRSRRRKPKEDLSRLYPGCKVNVYSGRFGKMK